MPCMTGSGMFFEAQFTRYGPEQDEGHNGYLEDLVHDLDIATFSPWRVDAEVRPVKRFNDRWNDTDKAFPIVRHWIGDSLRTQPYSLEFYYRGTDHVVDLVGKNGWFMRYRTADRSYFWGAGTVRSVTAAPGQAVNQLSMGSMSIQILHGATFRPR